MSTVVNLTSAIYKYRLVEQLYDGSRTLVYRAVQESDCAEPTLGQQHPVVIKLLKRQYPSFSELVQFRNQYAIAKNLDIPGIIKPYSLELYHNGYVLVMEDFGGISLQQFTQGQPLTPEQFFPIALQLATTLHQLHQQRVIHKDIKPANILIHPETRQIKLIDFAISTLLPRETQPIQSLNTLEGTLAYLSPEQTGRMNRGIDYRSDFYSLGVTSFELLTGQRPFQSHDPMELVHCHIAKPPPSICDLNPEIPWMLGEIIHKLMAKNAQERYQSALGLKHDLATCLEQWKSTGKLTWFQLGQRDVSDRFLIPEKLYGREQEVETLLKAFGRVANGAAELMLVAGFSGIGKTAVVNEVHKPIVRWNGYFIKGKFDQFNRNIPFSAFVQTFRDLMGQLLSESDTQLDRWKTKILQALGENGQVVIEVIPELEQIIGKQPPAPELSGTAAQNRFNRLFQKFVQVFTTPEHPLVIFLDDLQWADLASLNLMKLLMSETERGYLLIIGAYRDNEVFPAHPLMLTLEEIQKVATVNSITLAPLSQVDVNHLIADTLSCPQERAVPLSRLVYQKAKGNPFFTTQFLKALHEDGLITFDFDTGFWQCDVTQVRSLALTDDVVEFMAVQLQKLPTKTQAVLKLAACIGNSFDLNTLAIVYEKSQTQTASDLWKALQEGFVIPINTVYKFYQTDESAATVHTSIEKIDTCFYKFLHDRVQQAAYSLIPDDQKQITHLQIGRLLQQATPASERDEQLFAIVNHLNQGITLIVDEHEQQELVELNLEAGRKAKKATAYGAALDYFNTGISLLTSDRWHSQYSLALALYEAAANSAYLSANFEQMEQLAQVVLNHAHSWLDRVNVYDTKIQACVAQSQHLEALQLARKALEPLEVHLPEQPTQADIEQAFQHTQTQLCGMSIESLLNLPEMTAPEKKAAMVILSSVISAAYQAAPNLFPLVVFAQVHLSVQYGNAPESVHGYGQYGVMLIAIIGDIEAGYCFGQLEMNLLHHIRAAKLTSTAIFDFNCFFKHWKEPAKNTLGGLLQAYSSGLEIGDLDHAALSLLVYDQNAYFCGQELSSLKREMEDHRQVMRQLRQHAYLHTQSIYYQVVLNLLGETAQPGRLVGQYCDEHEMIQFFLKTGEVTALHQVYFNRLQLSYWFQHYEQALENANLAAQYLHGSAGLMIVPLFYFYDALVRLALYPDASETDQSDILERVAANQEKLSGWAVHAPSNQAHRHALVAAERCRVLGQRAEAIDLYDRAISLAKEHEYLNEEALTNELAAKFYLEWGKEKFAQSYLIEAYYGYARWGAKAKVADLEQRYPQLLAPILQQAHSALSVDETFFASSTVASTSSSSSSSVSDSLDLAAILKASQALSSEIEIDKLLSTLLHTVIQNAGADKCVLMLLEEGCLMVRSSADLSVDAASLEEGRISHDANTQRSPQPVQESDEVPISLINTVKRSLQPAVITNATVHPQFATDAYIQTRQPKSILCSPILHQGKLLGMVYLENNLTIAAFTSDRVELLNLLCAQAAISLENARLYQRSQQYAQQLKQSLDDLNASQSRFHNLVDNVPGVVYQLGIAPNGAVSMAYISADCYNLYEITPEQAVADVQRLIDMVHPEDAASYQQSIADSIQTLNHWHWEGRIVTPSGIVKWIHGKARIEQQADGFLVWDGMLLDISDRKQAEIEQQKLAAVVQNSADFIGIAALDGQTLYANPAGLLLLGLDSTEDISNYRLSDFYTPEDFAYFQQDILPQLIQQGYWCGEICWRHYKTGELIPVECNGFVIKDSTTGQPLCMATITRDIRDRKRIEAERQQKSKELETALQELQQAQLQIVQSEKMSTLGNLVAGVAHEINNPVGFVACNLQPAVDYVKDIFGLIDLYQQEYPKPTATIQQRIEAIDLEYMREDLPKLIGSMKLGVERIHSLSTSLRIFSRADNDYKVPFNIHEGIDSTILILKHRLKASEKRPAIEVIKNYGDLPEIDCFPGQLNQVFMNIMANAIDAIEDVNEKRISNESAQIKITTEMNDRQQIVIRIQDNGSGMTEAVKQRVFDYLFTTKAVDKGTGLGLAIAHQIVTQKHGGAIEVKSEVGRGTEFTIVLPVKG